MFRLICLLIGYAFGCFQTAYIAGKLKGNIDVRDYHSKSAGMTNAIRVLGIKTGIIIFFVDILKAVLAYITASLIFDGSGAFLGKHLVAAYLNNELPEHLQKLFAQKYPFSLPEVLDKVYRQPFPNRFLASFVEFLNENKSDSFVKDLVGWSFDEFLKKQVLRYADYDKYPLCFVGSVSFNFADELHKSAEKHGITISKIEQTPLDGLLKFHK